MSLASVGFSVSAIAGVPLGLWLSGFWSWRGVLWALTAATVAAAGALAFPLSAAPTAEQAAQKQPQRRGVSLAETRGILAATAPVLVVSFLAFAALGLVYTYLVVDLGYVWHWSNELIVGFLFFYGIANVTGNLVLGALATGEARAGRSGSARPSPSSLSSASPAPRSGTTPGYWRWRSRSSPSPALISQTSKRWPQRFRPSSVGAARLGTTPPCMAA
jgi:MFS family permease